MKNISEIFKKLDEKLHGLPLCVRDYNNDWKNVDSFVKQFITSEISELLEGIVVKERKSIGNKETQDWSEGWNDCREEIKYRIEEILK